MSEISWKDYMDTVAQFAKRTQEQEDKVKIWHMENWTPLEYNKPIMMSPIKYAQQLGRAERNKPMGRPKLPPEVVRNREVCHLRKFEQDFIARCIADGLYKTNSEVIEDALIALRRQLEDK